MTKIFQLVTVLFVISRFAVAGDLDSLKQQLQRTTNDSLKGPLYTQIAAEYLHFDTINSKRIQYIYQTNAIGYTLKAIHYYSRYNDTTGLTLSFKNLVKVYHAQKKYSQAKWFNLQAANLSRARNDIPEIINSLMELASIKVAIKDYKLAMRDLNEALVLSSKNHYPHQESAVMQSFALLYSNMKNYTKETAALKRRDEIEDSIKHAEEAKLIAKVDSAQDSLKIKDSVIVKKKVFIAKSKKNSKGNYTKKLASL